MTELDRLIKFLKGARKKSAEIFAEETKKWLQIGEIPKHKQTIDEIEADYLLENGVIVPPCKVGDTVYYICFGKIYKGKCHAITRHENSLQIHLYDYDGDNASFASDNVFPTRNEAENALAKKVFDLICED